MGSRVGAQILIVGVGLLMVLGSGCAEGGIDAVNDMSGNETSNQSSDKGNQSDDNQKNQGDDNQNGEATCADVECGSGLICDPEDLECVECVDDGDCPSGDVCDEENRECVACLDDDDCPGDTVCDVEDLVCTGCIEDDDCGPDAVCDDDVCVSCIVDDDCASGLVCDEEANACVECTGDDHCDDVCDVVEQVCVECISDADCDEACDVDEKVCVECVDDGHCAGDLVCDTTVPICVECVEDEHCSEELICDSEGGQTCLECLDDGDCDEGECHPDYGACISPCCEFMTESFAVERSVSFAAFEVVVDDEGVPVVGFADSDADQVIVARREAGSWSYDVVATINSDNFITSTPNLSMDIDSHGQAHLVLSNRNKLHYFRPSFGGWTEEIIDEFDGVGFFNRVGMVVDGEDTVHIVTEDGPQDGEFHYYWEAADGSGGSDIINAGTGQALRFIDMAVLSDHRPVFATSNYGDVGIFVYTRSSTGFWSAEPLGGETSNPPSIAIDEDDQMWVATSGDGHPVIWKKTSTGWEEEAVLEGPNSTGLFPQVDLDENGKPLLIHHGYDDDWDGLLFYTRREAGEWVQYEVSDFDNPSYPRLAYDRQAQIPHIVARNQFDTRMEYYTFDDSM